MRCVVHLVTDGRGGRRATAERLRRLSEAVPGAAVDVHLVRPAETLAAGFCVAEHALAGEPGRSVVAHDVTPGDADPGPWPEEAGLVLCVARSVAGALVLGPNVGWSWSFAERALASGLCRLDVPVRPAAPPAFDSIVTAIAHALAGHPHAVAGVVPRSAVPPVPELAVAHTDDAGNVRTTIAHLPAARGAQVVVRILEVSAPATVTDAATPDAEGELTLRPTPLGVELHLGGGSAAERFGAPPPGAPIEVGQTGAAGRRTVAGP